MADSKLRVVVEGRDDLTPQFRKIESGVIRFVGAVSASLAAIRIGSAPIIAAAQFERELANVAKTTGFVSKALQGGIGDLDRTGEALKNMSLRIGTSAVDLAKIAAAAGQQGLGRYGVKGVIQFTDSVSRMANVLDLTAEDSATSLGKIVNIFRIPLLEVERTVSTINEITNRSTADGEDLIDTIKRIGDAAGSLNLEQAAALGATGLDFGLTPEVIGTTFNKLFSSFLSDADRYAKVVKGLKTEAGELLTGSAEQFIRVVQKDGIEGLKLYVKALRGMTQQAQQSTIEKLSGGGRQQAAINKLVQDTSDTVLNRNLEAALDGRKGLSAIDEQARVTQTLSEQTKILGNSVVKLGTDAAEKLLPKLTALTAQLSEAIQTPEFKQFVDAAVTAVGDLVFALVDVVKWVSSLNINWENLIVLLKAFLAVKAAQALGGWISGWSLFGVSLKSLAKDAAVATNELNKTEAAAKKSGAAMAAESKKGIGGWLAQASGMDVYLERRKRIKDALAAQKKAVEDLAAAEKTQAAAAQQAVVQATSTGKANTTARNASQASAGVRANLTAVTKKANDAVVKIESDRAAKLKKIANDTNATRLAIEQDYQNQRKAMQAAGSKAGLAQLNRDREALLSAEDAHYQRSVRATQSYYDRKLSLQRTNDAKGIAAARSAMAAQLVAERQARQKSNTAGAAQAGVNAGLAAATAGVAAAQSRVKVLDAAVETAKKSISGIGAAVRGLAGVLALAGRVISAGFFWVTILYTLVDLTVGFDKVLPLIQKFTDALGFSSKAARDAAVRQRELAEASKKARAEYEDLVAAYNKRLNPSTGQIDLKKVEADAALLKSSDSVEKQQEALLELARTAQGAIAKRDRYLNQVGADFSTGIKEAQAGIEKLRKEIDQAQKFRDKALQGVNSEEVRLKISEDYQRQIAAAEKSIAALNKKIEELGKSGKTASEEAARAAKDVATIGSVIARAFTPESLKGLGEFVVPVGKAAEDYQRAQKAYLEARNDAAKSADQANKPNDDALREQVNRTDIALVSATRKLQEFVRTMANAPGLSEQSKGALELLLKISQIDPALIASIFNSMAVAPVAPLTGEGAPKPAPASSGTRDFDPKPSGSGEESEARKIRRARLQLEKAKLEAENALFQKQTDLRLAEEKDKLDQGLITIENYYDKRESLQLEALNKEITLKEKETELIAFEEEKAKKKSEKLKLQADRVRVNGEIAVLAQQRKEILDNTARELKKETDAYRARVLSETNKLVEDGVISEETSATFQRNLDALLLDYRDFLAQLRTSGRGALADSLEASFNIQAYRAAFVPLSKEVEIAFTSISRKQADIERMAASGLLVAAEAAALLTAGVREQIPLLESKIKIMESELGLLRQRPGITEQAVQAEIEQIEQLKDELKDLKAVQNEVAASINKSIGDSINTFLDDATSGTKSFTELANSLLYDLANNIRKVFIDDLTQRFLRSAGLSADGGIGGYLAGVLAGGPTGESPATAATSAVTGTGGVAANQALQTATTAAATSVTQFATAVTTAIPQIQGAVAGVALPAVGEAADAATTVGTEAAKSAALELAMTTFTGALGAGAGAVQVAVATIVTAFGTITGPLAGVFTAAQAAATGLYQVAAASTAGAVAGAFHSGGIAGGKPTFYKRVHPAVFANAPRYHSGTASAGLSSKEVPAILEKGEAVLTERQQGMLSSALDSTSAKPMNIRNVLVTDPNFVPDSMNSAAGEKVLMTFIQRNRLAIRSAIG